MTPSRYHELKAAIINAGYGHDIDWAQGVKAPESAEDFAGEVIWVILCSGMKEQVARIIQGRVWAAIKVGKPVKGNVLGKSGKAAAIDTFWRDRVALFTSFKTAPDKVAYIIQILDIFHVKMIWFYQGDEQNGAGPDHNGSRSAGTPGFRTP